MVKINLLFYTDYRDCKNPKNEFTIEIAEARKGLSMLRDLILKNKPEIVEVNICLINRNESKPGQYKLTRELLSKFDELWVFGYYQNNVDGEFKSAHGGPENELDDSEVKALDEWMKLKEGKQGGILITGDHSNLKPPEKKLPYVNLGKALGHRIPRAGKMRKWCGPPTTIKDNFNTQSFGEDAKLENPNLQNDAEPQHIHLWMNEEIPQYQRIPHELFDSPAGIINIFPDHPHEGELIDPKSVDSELSELSIPLWSIVAWGADNRFSFPNPRHFSPLVSVYDGHGAKEPVGRIVADSSWHHYTNVNLRCLPGDPVGGGKPRAPLNLMGHFYWNLVRWLAPKEKRVQIKHEILYHLAHHPEAIEVASSDDVIVGRAAEYAAQLEGLSHEVKALLRDDFPKGWEKLQTPPLYTRLFGHVVTQYQQTGWGDVFKMDLFDRKALAKSCEIISKSFCPVLKMHLLDVGEQVEKHLQLLPTLPSASDESE